MVHGPGTVTGQQAGRMMEKARRVIAIQLGITGLVAAGFLLLAGSAAAGAALIGGGIAAAASWLFAKRVFGPGAEDPRRFVRRLFVAECLKIAATIGLFVVVLLLLDVAYLPLFVAYAASLLAYWLALLTVF